MINEFQFFLFTASFSIVFQSKLIRMKSFINSPAQSYFCLLCIQCRLFKVILACLSSDRYGICSVKLNRFSALSWRHCIFARQRISSFATWSVWVIFKICLRHLCWKKSSRSKIAYVTVGSIILLSRSFVLSSTELKIQIWSIFLIEHSFSPISRLWVPFQVIWNS